MTKCQCTVQAVAVDKLILFKMLVHCIERKDCGVNTQGNYVYVRSREFLQNRPKRKLRIRSNVFCYLVHSEKSDVMDFQFRSDKYT